MSLVEDPNFSHNVNHSSSKTSEHESEQPIDAEIIAETQTTLSSTDETDENIINLLYYPVLEEEEYNQTQQSTFPEWLKRVLNPLSTPWGLGSL